MVAELLFARAQLLAAGGGEKEPATPLVGKELDGEAREPVRLQEPAQLAGRDMQLVEAVGDVGVILQVAGVSRAARPPAAVQPAIVVRERTEQELRQLACRIDEVRTAEPAPR